MAVVNKFHECVVSGVNFNSFIPGSVNVEMLVAVDLGWTEADVERVFYEFLGKRVKMTLEVIPETDGGPRS